MAILLFGAKRSGNHLVRAWLGDEFNQDLASRNSHIFNIKGFGRLASSLKRANGLSNFPIIGVEDLSYTDMVNFFIGSSAKDLEVLEKLQEELVDQIIHLIRDPINVLASILAILKSDKPEYNRLKMQPGFMSPLNLLEVFPKLVEEHDNVLQIKYEDFISSEEYRRSIEAQLPLGFQGDDSVLDTQHKPLKSSFTDSEEVTDEDRKSMKARWKNFIDDPEYLWYLKYPGLLETREKVYGPLPGELQEALSKV